MMLRNLLKIIKTPFYNKIVFKVFILVCVVLFGALGINLILTNKMIDSRMEQRLINNFNSAHNTTENFITLVSETSQMWAKEIVANHFDFHNMNKKSPDILSKLLNIEKNKMSADSIILLDKKGIILAQAGSKYKVGDSLKYRDIVKKTLKEKNQITKIARENEAFIIYSSAVIRKDNDLNGILLVGYFINDVFLENIKKNTSLELAFIGNSAVMSSTKWGTSKNIDTMPISYIKYQNLLNNPQTFKEINYKNKDYMVSAKQLNNIESLITGSILFGFSYDKIKQEKSELLDKKLMIFYLTILFALTFIYIVTRKHLKAINKLTQGMNSVSNNQDYETITINTKDEIELLANSFNHMGAELNILHSSMEKEIENKTQELQELNNNLESKVILEVARNRQKDKQIMQQSRLAQMGEMIAMIAHQWRQPLAAVSSTSTAINLKAKLNKLDNNTAIDLSDKISGYSQHLSSTIDDFREFFKADKKKQETTYKKLVKSILNIIEASLANENIQLITKLNDNETLYSYSNEIKQVILNLLKNAEDVLLEKEIKNPKITIETHNGILIVSDNGGGIADDIIDKIFDPYFSTKTKKDGTGLGLYMSKTIIEEHCGGTLSVANNEDGAVFKIILGTDKSPPSRTI